MTDRPFSVLGIQQIAIGGLDTVALQSLWIGLLGLESAGKFRIESENVHGERLKVGPWPLQVDVNLSEPLDPERSPRVHRPPLNHIGLWVDDLVAAVEWLNSRGVHFTPGGIRRGAAGHDMCFIHPKHGGEGVLIELVQAPPEVIETFRRLGRESPVRER
jgi:lactoylglutathione lyase